MNLHASSPSVPRGAKPALAWLSICLLFTAALRADEPVVSLWKDGAPGWKHVKPEASEDKAETGRLDRWVSYVSHPTLTFYAAPNAKPDADLVLVVPGGGYRYVCIDKEGIEAARWLNTIGLHAAVLKYRTLDPDKTRNAEAIVPLFADTERAMRVVRQSLPSWGVKPKRIGVLGFSAGAVMAVRLVMEADAGNASAPDAAERENSRPDFVALVYGAPPPGKLPSGKLDLPPFFIVHAVDDPKAVISGATKIFNLLNEAGGSVELHAYRRGDHGFGVAPKMGSVKAWPAAFAAWHDDL